MATITFTNEQRIHDDISKSQNVCVNTGNFYLYVWGIRNMWRYFHILTNIFLWVRILACIFSELSTFSLASVVGKYELETNNGSRILFTMTTFPLWTVIYHNHIRLKCTGSCLCLYHTVKPFIQWLHVKLFCKILNWCSPKSEVTFVC